MPEVVERRLICDRSRCGRNGRKFLVVTPDGDARAVILCDTHDKPLVDLAELGEPAQFDKPAKPGGLDKARLYSLIQS